MNRIFISSTCFDLIDLRAEIKEFILSLGLTPVMSDHSDTEFKTYQDQNSIQTCLTNLRTCDVVIVILSQRYGPSLKDAGFEDYSATHLEYKEAIEKEIKTLVFVRDRLDADYTIFLKTKDTKKLPWIKDEKDTRLFEIISGHKKLLNENKNNWYWTFKDSVDLKQRLRIDLKNEIDSNRLNELVSSGNCVLVTAKALGSYSPGNSTIYTNITIENMGNQAAIEPIALVFMTNNYNQVISHNLDKSIKYSLEHFNSLKPGSQYKINDVRISYNGQPHKVIIEIVYRTIYGDLVSDMSELNICVNGMAVSIFPTYKLKRYLSGSVYENLVINKF